MPASLAIVSTRCRSIVDDVQRTVVGHRDESCLKNAALALTIGTGRRHLKSFGGSEAMIFNDSARTSGAMSVTMRCGFTTSALPALDVTSLTTHHDSIALNDMSDQRTNTQSSACVAARPLGQAGQLNATRAPCLAKRGCQSARQRRRRAKLKLATMRGSIEPGNRFR
jgi:hypothetical protein